MLAGPHLAVEALTGRVFRRAWVALPLAFASHYVLDALPHSYLSLREPGHLPLKLAIVSVDFLIGVALVLWLARGNLTGGSYSAGLWRPWLWTSSTP